MAKEPRAMKINLKDVSAHPELQPKVDQHFKVLFKLAVNEKIPTYFGQVPLRLIRPFDASFLPQFHPDGEQGIQFMANRIDLENPPSVWVYPKEGMFILSDDYHAYEAFRVAHAEHLPCYILGAPAVSELLNVEGPLKKERILRSMGVVMT